MWECGCQVAGRVVVRRTCRARILPNEDRYVQSTETLRHRRLSEAAALPSFYRSLVSRLVGGGGDSSLATRFGEKQRGRPAVVDSSLVATAMVLSLLNRLNCHNESHNPGFCAILGFALAAAPSHSAPWWR